MKLNLFEDVFMGIDWSLYDDETAELSGLEKKIYRDMVCTHHPKTKEELVEAIEEELKNGNTDLNCIDTSAITDMSELFDQLDGIRLSEERQKALDISEWDVSNVKDMEYMFYDCANFNQDLSKWDVRKVESMYWMFAGCENFNQDLSGWDVRNVIDTRSMFYDCIKLKENGLIPDWYKYKI